MIEGSCILVTGGAGFVGSHIVDKLLEENPKKVVIVDNFLRGSEQNISHFKEKSNVSVVKGDIRDQKLLSHLFLGIDYCFHMAALRITRCAENPKEAFEVMHQGTLNIVENCIKYKIKKLIAASSASIYGMADIFPTKEDHHPYNNRTLYGALKASNELVYRSYHKMYGLNYAAMRYFNIYGPRMDTEGKYTEVLIRWYRMIKEGKSPKIFGDGSQTMDFVYVEDVAKANILALKAPCSDQVYNVASGVETSLSSLCKTLIDVMGSSIEPEYVPIPKERENVEVKRRLADTFKAKREIGFQSQVPLEEGLQRLTRWLEKYDKQT